MPRDKELVELVSPIAFRAATRVIERIEAKSISFDAAFQETMQEFKLSAEEQKISFLLAKRTLENIGPPIYLLRKNNKQDLPLRRKGAFYVAFYLASSSPSFTLDRIRALRGGLVSDSLLSLLTPRNLDRLFNELEEMPITLRLSYKESVPPLIVETFLSRFGEKATPEILKSLRYRQVWVRLNDTERKDWLEDYLKRKGFRFRQDKDYPYLLEILPTQEIPLPSLPPEIATYQDKASIIAVEALISLRPKGVIVDLAAAPCMKASLLCRKIDHDAILLVDISEKRTRACIEIMKATNCNYQVINSDGRFFSSSKLFSAAVVDAPCTNSGAISRDPGLRLALWSLRREDLSRMKQVQLELLTNALKLVHRGALVLYSTCSLFPEEGEEVISSLKIPIKPLQPFLPPNIERTIHKTCGYCYRLYPHVHRTDGFFFSILSPR
ncbi:MAG: hypothetical protein ACP5GL_06910 [Infirmifilum sp.]